MDMQEALKRASKVYGVKPEEIKQVAVVMMALDKAVEHIRHTTSIKTISSCDIFDLLFTIQNDPSFIGIPLVHAIVKTWDRDQMRHVAEALAKKYTQSPFCGFLKGLFGSLYLGLLFCLLCL